MVLLSGLHSVAQQYTMKGGVSNGSVTVPPRDAADKSGHMLNYYWEFNYAYRFAKCRFVSAGLAYLGAGCTFHYTYQPTGFVAPYNVKSRFNNVLVPVKFKVSTEHRARPRYYGYLGAAPGWMFEESRDMQLEYIRQVNKDGTFKDSDKDLTVLYQKNNIPHWTPKKFQNYLLAGGGVYYKHVLLDVSLYVSTYKDYEEFLAPVSFNYGAIFCIGYQVSRDSKKRW